MCYSTKWKTTSPDKGISGNSSTRRIKSHLSLFRFSLARNRLETSLWRDPFLHEVVQLVQLTKWMPFSLFTKIGNISYFSREYPRQPDLHHQVFHPIVKEKNAFDPIPFRKMEFSNSLPVNLQVKNAHGQLFSQSVSFEMWINNKGTQ